MKDFKYWEKKFEQQDLVDFMFDKEGLLWQNSNPSARKNLKMTS